ncbi:MAG TPA: sugar ABC transporter ATP-binding protein [Terrimicrobiaceae bacterium]
METDRARGELHFEGRNLSKRFGPQYALRDVSIDIRSHQVHAVTGENGAGKSTLMNIICGKLRPTEGELRWNGAALNLVSPIDARRAGIAIAPQELNLCAHLTVAENIFLGNLARGKLGIDWRETLRSARDHLSAIDPTIDPLAKAGTLSAAHQQLVQIARATATRAKLLIFDEPTAALTDREAVRLFDFISRFRANGGAIFYISHRLDEVLQLADRVSVLRDGRFIIELEPRRTSKDEIVRHMAGRDLAGRHLRPGELKREHAQVVLRVHGLSRSGEFESVDLELHRGEILAISGLIGSGRTELGKCIFGLTRPDRGEIEIEGRPIRHRTPADAILNGLVYLPEERKKEGIFPLLSVTENICIASLKEFLAAYGLRRGQMLKTAVEYMRRLTIRAQTPRMPLKNLSGGNQQKTILARWLLSNCRILILDEPTRGIDVNAKFEIQTLLRELAGQGLSMIYISSEMQEILEVSDRILVMHEGRVKGVVETPTTTQETLLGLAMA